MPWQRKKPRRKWSKSKTKHYSLSNKLRREGKSNEEFEIMLNQLSLEEVIGLKLDVTSKFTLEGKLYGIPIWQALPSIIREAVLKYALSATRSQIEASRFLGIQLSYLAKLCKEFDTVTYFEEDQEK